ncbi:transporter substrate-binding domain-containing protein [uncultured Pseudodesulfovibrio sp.]|uniref:substrate-binding periplasmic protein n=1 Tax=uncultured Pseudodesulfovibrio sp. TaxID=2035858 RepID=UPI0029C69573|nr:transporter substrate-binding domain-containing protein [uncultured Pseudodesulfovibrio sp.]
MLNPLSYRIKKSNSLILNVFIAIFISAGLSSLSGLANAADSNTKKFLSQQRPQLTFSTFLSEGMGVLFERILTEAYAQLGYDVTIKGFPAERALAMSNEGLVDGEAGRVSVIEGSYTNLIRVPTPLYTNRVAAFSRQAHFNTKNGWNSLKGYSVGAVLGYKFIEKMTEDLDTVYFRNYSILFKALDNNRIDVAVSEYLEALPTLGQLHLIQIGSHYPLLAHNPMYHYLHKSKAWLIPAIDSILHEMEKSGRMDEILNELEAEYKDYE